MYILYKKGREKDFMKLKSIITITVSSLGATTKFIPVPVVILLLSVQISGCSNKQSDLPEQEFSWIQENDLKESQTTIEVFSDENTVSAMEAENHSETINRADEAKTYHDSQPQENNTISANTVNSSQNTALQPEKRNPTTDNDYYRVATNISSAEVERYAAQVRQQFLGQDWSAISSEIAYPITISDKTYENSEDFLKASSSYGSNLNKDFLTAVENEDCVEMFCNYEGIMLGESGQIWIGEVLNADFSSQGLKIIAVNGLLKADSDDTIVDAVVKVYAGFYIDETGLYGDSLEGKTLTYYSVRTSNVTKNSFDFQIIAVPVENGSIQDNLSKVFRAGTANFIEDGKKAVYHNDTENLYFLFGDDQIEPTLGKIEIKGVKELEGKVYINNSIPGHEAG